MFTVTEAFAQFKLNAKMQKADRKMGRKLAIVRLAGYAVSDGDSTTAIYLAIKYYKYTRGGCSPRVNDIMCAALDQHVTSLVEQAREVPTLKDKLVFVKEAFAYIEKYKKWLVPHIREATVLHLQNMAGEIID
jgi:hypothetical protein